MADKKNPKNEVFYAEGKDGLSKHSLPDDCFVTHGNKQMKWPDRTGASRAKLRSGFNRHDKDAFRPEDRIPRGHTEILIAVQAIYHKIGFVRNVIDLMADFASEGLELEHPIKSQKRFYEKWAKKVDLQGRAHDFMKLLLRDANVVIRRKDAKISLPLARDMTKASHLGQITVIEDIPDETSEKVSIDKKKRSVREIPWKYTFLSPVLIEKIGGDVGRFFGDNTIAMRIPAQLRDSILNPKTKTERAFIEQIPEEIKQLVRNKKGDNLLKLNPDKMYVDYYKKDDWEDWGTPFLYGVLEDIMFKEKMRLADMTALDGVINVIRLWKLGNSDKQILPTKTAVNKLLDILQHNVGGGTMDIVWDDMIDLTVEYPPTDKILGPEKYLSVNQDIVRGLGIPDSLIGGTDLGTRNAESAYVQLKTLTERLEYIRSRCIVWIQNELRLVADAMGFKNTPNVVFGTMSLRNEAAEKQLIIQLLDRGIVSIESVQRVFGYDFMVELQNMKGEQDIREKDPAILEKGNPYYRPITTMTLQHEFQMELERLKQGSADDGGGGGGDNPSGDQPKDEGKNPPGRPPSTVDTAPRDERDTQVLSVYKVVAEEYLDQIDLIVDPLFLKSCKAKNLRSLTRKQKEHLEATKRVMLITLDMGDRVTAALLKSRLTWASSKLIDMYNSVFKDLYSKHAELIGKPPNIKERRSLAASAWAMLRL